MNTLVTEPKSEDQYHFLLGTGMLKSVKAKSICTARQQAAALIAQQILRCDKEVSLKVATA
jgi:hypothetical protein